jgi:drug/metabolite transporter (DMT)-like permease
LKWRGPLYLSLAAGIWGGMYVVSKEVLLFIQPWLLLEMRFFLGLLTLSGIVLYKKAWAVKRKDFGALALLSFIGYTCSIGMQFIGTSLSGAAMGSLITAASPALISIFALWLLREQLHIYKWLSLFIASLGVIIIIGLPSSNASSFLGNVILFGAALTWALYTVLSRRQTMKYSSLTVTFWASVFGVIFTAPIAVWESLAAPVSLPTNGWIWAGVLYMGVISTAGAFYLWNKGFEYINTATGSLFFFMQPVVGSTLGFFLLDEALDWNFFAGACLIASGIFLSSRESARPHRTASCNQASQRKEARH